MKNLIILAALTTAFSTSAIASASKDASPLDEDCVRKLVGSLVNITVNINGVGGCKKSGAVATTEVPTYSTGSGVTAPVAQQDISGTPEQQYQWAANTFGDNSGAAKYIFANYYYSGNKNTSMAINALDYLTHGSITGLRNNGLTVSLSWSDPSVEGSILKISGKPKSYTNKDYLYNLSKIGLLLMQYKDGKVPHSNLTYIQAHSALDSWGWGTGYTLDFSPYQGQVVNKWVENGGYGY